jgi:type II secretory pathway component GspD/PulD (secretin)
MEKLRFTIACAIALGALNAVALGQAPTELSPEVPLVAEEPKILDKDVRLTFSFRYQPWQEVLDWFAEQAGLSLVFETLPPGTFNYNDTRTYTPAEALDVLNSVLQIKGYTLVRKDRMLVVVNLEDPIPPNLVPDISLEELDERGEHELVRVLFPVWNMTPDQAAQEIQHLMGPQGKAVTLPQARHIQVTETAGRLRAIRSIINSVEQPDLVRAGMREFKLKYLTYEAAMPTIKQMMGIPEESTGTPDGTMQITKSATDEKLLVRGTAQHSARLEEILRLIDVPEAAAGISGAPQLEVYTITVADPDAVKDALEILLRDDPTVKLSADDENGFLIAIARPAQQATIRATIDQMQKDGRDVDVIALSNLDPQVAVLAINKLFGGTGEEPDPRAPKVDADISSRRLLVRGTASQVAQIRAMLRKMGESEDDESGAVAARRQRVRVLPLSGAAARTALSQIEQIWPSVSGTRIRIISPSGAGGIRTYRPTDTLEESAPAGEPSTPSAATLPFDNASDSVQGLWQMFRNGYAVPAPAQAPAKPEAEEATEENDRMTSAPERAGLFRFAAQENSDADPPQTETGAEETADDASLIPQAEEPEAQRRARRPAARPNQSPGSGAPIVIAPGPGGTLIASDDVEALDQLEELLGIVAGKSTTTGREYAVFYLKYSKASTIAEVLAAIFGGRTGGNDRGLIGEMASSALGNMGGALMGDLLMGGGSSGGVFTSANVDIVPDARLNALIVHAKPADLDTIEQLLKVLDQASGPEDVEAEAEARLIPVYNAPAQQIANIVQQLYQDRMTGPGAVMSPQDMMRMLKGGPNTEQSIQKMSVAVDSDNNNLIVRAPDPLFEEISLLVERLDQSMAVEPDVTRLVPLKHTNTAAVQRALTSIIPNASSSTATDSRENRRRRGDDDDDDSPQEIAQRQMRRQMEQIREFQQMQERFGGGGRGGGDRGGGDRGGGDRGGGFGRGGFPGGFPGGGGFGGFRGRGGGDGGGGRGRGGDRD